MLIYNNFSDFWVKPVIKNTLPCIILLGRAYYSVSGQNSE